MTIEERIEAINDVIANTHGGKTLGMKALLRERGDRLVRAGEIWQVGTDVALVLSGSAAGWLVRSLYTEREYTAEDADFFYYCQEPGSAGQGE